MNNFVLQGLVRMRMSGLDGSGESGYPTPMRLFFLLGILLAAGCRASGPKPAAEPPPASFYRELIENECTATGSKETLDCCIRSVRQLEQAGLEPLPPEADRCPEGKRMWSKGCAGSLQWCR